MGDFWGALAGIGMLALIGALFVRFLREMGWMRRETARMLLRVTAGTGGVFAVLMLAAFLIRRTLYGAPASLFQVGQIFTGPAVQRMLDALEHFPGSVGPIGFLFACLGRALGTLLFGQYRLGGMVLAFLMTDAGACLLYAPLSARWSPAYAGRAVFLLLCLPGSVFLFLPGWAPMLFFGAALTLFLAERLWLKDRFPPAPAPLLSPPLYDGLLCLCALLSAMVTACAAQGWIG